jgi:glycosyltransferase involved in cell wall biosynthesis
VVLEDVLSKAETMEIKFKVVVPTFNAEKWIQKCIDSISKQQYSNWEAIIIDDLSTDNTRREISKSAFSDMFTLRFNKTRKRALQNLVEGIKCLNCEDEDVIVIIDGDDWLPHEGVFSRLVREYQNPDIWLTYGTYEIYPRGVMTDKTRQVTKDDDIRRGPMLYRHLRTFKYFLWKNVKDEDLRYKLTGEYYPTSYDVAMMKPMVEMAGIYHVKHIDEKMYVYNHGNPLGDGKVNYRFQAACGGEIRKRPRYSTHSKHELIVGIKER